jgi:O-acetyl-ADP-ribose deacetylase (regulator of RNase III)
MAITVEAGSLLDVKDAGVIVDPVNEHLTWGGMKYMPCHQFGLNGFIKKAAGKEWWKKDYQNAFGKERILPLGTSAYTTPGELGKDNAISGIVLTAFPKGKDYPDDQGYKESLVKVYQGILEVVNEQKIGKLYLPVGGAGIFNNSKPPRTAAQLATLHKHVLDKVDFGETQVTFRILPKDMDGALLTAFQEAFTQERKKIKDPVREGDNRRSHRSRQERKREESASLSRS